MKHRLLLALALASLLAVTLVAQQSPKEVEAAFRAYEAGDYQNARAALEALGRAGNARAQFSLGRMYEGGLGVVRNFVQAYHWYSLAAATGNPEYVKSLDALAAKMTKEEIAKAQASVSSGASAGRVTSADSLGEVTLTASTCSMFGERLGNNKVLTFRSDATADQMVYDIVYYSGLRPNFQVRAANVPNAAARVEADQRFILYNPEFMRQVATSTGTDWAAYSIMAHEIGHHLQGHTLEPGGSRPPIELEADEFSGFILARMDGTLAQAQAAMNRLASETGSATHPAKAQRLAAIKAGWEKGRQTRADGTTKPPVVDDDPTTRPDRRRKTGPGPDPMPPPPPQQPATACYTHVGACPMVVAIPVGSSCVCNFWPNGIFAGVAR
jgi:hypothetical protein